MEKAHATETLVVHLCLLRMEGRSILLYSCPCHLSLCFDTRYTQIGIVSYGSECPSHGVYARVTEVKHWIQYIARGAVDSNCNAEIPLTPGNIATEQYTTYRYV